MNNNNAEKIIDSGGRLGRSKIIKYLKRKNDKCYDKIYLCECDCGNKFEASLQRINKCIILKRIFQCQECAKNKQKQAAKEMGRKTIAKNSKSDCVEATKISKLARIKAQKNNSTCNYAGIRYHNNAYEVAIGINGKSIYIGRSKNLNDAIKMRENAIEKYHNPIINKYKK